jgi:hypothetical protein
MEEIWKDIPGYEGLYQVSTLGRIKSLRFNKEKILNPALSSGRYLCVGLRKDGKSTTKRIHKLVSITFLNNNDNNYELVVDHINGDILDNQLSNIRIITQQENHFNRTTAKGFSFNKLKNKFTAYICVNGKTKHLGSFKNEEEAKQAYLNAKKIYHIIKQ